MNKKISNYYSKNNLIDKILNWLENSGADMNDLRNSELRKFDHFHTNGSKATVELADLARLARGSSVLDVGCGIGGPLRKLADLYEITGVGIDLTEEFVTAARVITEKVNLNDKLQFLVADALALPFENKSFDAVLIQHVVMNIENKTDLFKELHRILKNDGLLMLQEVVRKNEQALTYPAFWAEDESISYLPDETNLKKELVQTGFQEFHWKEITPEAIGFYEMMLIALNKPDRSRPNLGEIIHGDSRSKTENLLIDMKEGKIGVVMGVYRAI